MNRLNPFPCILSLFSLLLFGLPLTLAWLAVAGVLFLLARRGE